jgi:LuxR family transcriptional regulator, maltose regulon positive regulatory protein
MRKNSKPLVQINSLVNYDGTDSATPIQVGSLVWYDWLTNHDGFIYEGGAGHFTARSELRRGIRYWYSYRRREGKLTKTYLGKSEELTLERLEQASAILAGQVPLDRLIGSGAPSELMVASKPEAAAIIPPPEALAEVPYQPLTKFTPPALPKKLIARPRLTQRINAPATLISAPCGFGKTTLLNEWKQTCGMPVAWATLDANDNHPQRFWSTVVIALQALNSSLGQDWLSQLRSAAPPSLLNTTINLTNDIVRVTDGINAPGMCLVLDDFHYIQQTEIHASLQTWLEQLPSKFQLVITSNFKLPLALGYLRAKGTAVELKADDLRFTLEEGVDFLKQHTSGQALAHSDMQTLVKRTEGWAAGLVLATSVLSQQDNRSKVMELFTGAHTFLREFFMESVLRQQCPDVKNFLLKTSLLEHLTGSLCNALTGRSDGDEMLGRLWEESLFLERLEQPGWYRYHEMFAEMLRTQLQEQFPTEIPRLHRKAAKWYRAQGSPAEAIHHLLLSKAWEESAILIEAVALSELEQLGEDSRLLRWLQQLPEAVVQQHKTLLVVYIRLARLGLPPKELDDFLSRTEMSIASMPASEKTNALQETLAEIQRIHHLRATDEQARLGLHTSREQDTVGQMLDGILQCHRDCRVDLIKAEAEAHEVYETALAKNHLFSILMAGGACANLAFSQGHLRRSEQIANKVLRQAIELRDKLPEPASIALTALSGVYFERNQLAQAQQLLERAIEVDPNPIGTNESIIMAILRAKLQSQLGDDDAAFATIQTVRESYSHHPSNIWLEQDLIAYQALFRLHQGDLTSAERHLGGGWEIEKNPFSAFIRASTLVQQNRNVAAEEILSNLLDQYPHSFYWVPILRARVMLSIALFNQQKINQARQVMAEAARIAAPEFFVRPFLSSEPQISSLLSLVLHTENLNPGTRSFIKGTLTTLGHADGIQKASSRDEPVPFAIAASISPREQQILQSICAGLSNREIAEQYSISASTVKTHLENIFRKLDVNSRTQAIGQAQALGLLQV